LRKEVVVFILAFYHRKLFSGNITDEIKLGPILHRRVSEKWLSVPGVLRFSQSYFNRCHNVIGVGGEPTCERNPVRIPQLH
jgi:hypothetical protein